MARRWFQLGGWRRASAPVDAKASRTGALVALQTGGRAVWTPRDYGAFAREGYLKNPFVYRAVRMLSEGVASIPWVLTDGLRELDVHPALDLLARPNPRDGRAALLEAVVGHLLIAGNAYVEAVSVDGRAAELHVLRPDRVRVVPGPDGWPAAFEYSAGGRTLRLPAEADRGPSPVMHITTFHPLDDHYGAAPIEAAAASLDVHNVATEWNKALLDNAARPSGALVYGGGGGFSDEQFERLQRELADGYQGARNAGRPMLLEGGLDWKPMSLSPKDMDFLEARNAAAREVALVFGVPPMLLGVPGDATYANYQEANRAFWRQAVVPLATRVAEAFGRWLLASDGDGRRLGFRLDLDQVPALAAERDGLFTRLAGADFLTRDEKRIAAGYAPDGGAAAAGSGLERSGAGLHGAGDGRQAGGDPDGGSGGGTGVAADGGARGGHGDGAWT
ncbi:phage portal protein [Chthonobacter rhizosphaerae]|uniref:phage portal protein n=1 Tax=Chthonobacter rhizosphaerae TaxID=2735553 RepID=UPI0015EFB07F|nr:phage portal protein [Chthonobacter rhizosphaerae]